MRNLSTMNFKAMKLEISLLAINNYPITKCKLILSKLWYSKSTTDFSKMTERDKLYMIKGKEAYKNIMRDNEKIEFLD